MVLVDCPPGGDLFAGLVQRGRPCPGGGLFGRIAIGPCEIKSPFLLYCSFGQNKNNVNEVSSDFAEIWHAF